MTGYRRGRNDSKKQLFLMMKVRSKITWTQEMAKNILWDAIKKLSVWTFFMRMLFTNLDTLLCSLRQCLWLVYSLFLKTFPTKFKKRWARNCICWFCSDQLLILWRIIFIFRCLVLRSMLTSLIWPLILR